MWTVKNSWDMLMKISGIWHQRGKIGNNNSIDLAKNVTSNFLCVSFSLSLSSPILKNYPVNKDRLSCSLSYFKHNEF